MRRIIQAIIFFLLLITSAYGQTMIPPHDGFVADEANVISGTEKQQLQESIAASRRDYGANIAVISITNLQGESPENFSIRVLNAWGINSQGVVIMISNSPRAICIQATADAVSRFSRDAREQCIAGIIAPQARAGAKGQAFLAAVSWAQGKFMGASAPQPMQQQFQPERANEWTWGQIAIVVIIVIVVLFILMAASNSRSGGSWTFIDLSSGGSDGGSSWSSGDSGGSSGGY